MRPTATHRSSARTRTFGPGPPPWRRAGLASRGVCRQSPRVFNTLKSGAPSRDGAGAWIGRKAGDMRRLLGISGPRWATLLALAALALLPAAAHAAPLGFASPVYVDKTLAGGEPSVAYATKSGLLVYTSHEGTTHLFSSNIPGAPAESGGWIANYRNQVNIWTSANNGASWQVVSHLAGFFTDPLVNTGFSDPDLPQDERQNIYNTGIDLAHP